MKENFQIRDVETGKIYWISRACAVTGLIIAKKNGETFFLLEKRGKNCPDNVGKLCSVCGYLNWGETRLEAVKRETYEETGIDCDKIKCNIKEWKTIDDPKLDARENVVTRYIMEFDYDDLVGALKSGIINTDTKSRGGEEGEVESFHFLSYKEIHDSIFPDSFAFNHRDMIEEYIIEI